MSTDKLWDGRFTEQTHATVERFTASVQYDRRLAAHDIAGSIAHARMLARVGVLTAAEGDALVDGLTRIGDEIERGDFEWSAAREDVHMNIEARLTELLGETGKKLHTARSRNDQVVTDMRLYTRAAIDDIRGKLLAVQNVLLELAEREADTIMPGFTHMQPAQPVTLGHHLLAWFEMLQRDRERLADGRTRVNVCPLGCAALAGTSFPVDREMTAAELGFEGVCENSLDAVSDRDFIVELSAHAALLMVHLSRIAEELVLWASAQFGFVDLGDAFCTGSSIMPQKKNPDVAELIRGKTGRVAGNLMALLMLLKAQPLAYNRDNQEDKEALFDTVDTVTACLEVLGAMLPQVRFERETMRRAAARGCPTATDLADYLARKSMPFREAHAVVGRAVRYTADHGKDLAELSLEELRSFCAQIDDDIYAVLTLEGSVNARDHVGGTAPGQVRAAVIRGRARLEKP